MKPTNQKDQQGEVDFRYLTDLIHSELYKQYAYKDKVKSDKLEAILELCKRLDIPPTASEPAEGESAEKVFRELAPKITDEQLQTFNEGLDKLKAAERERSFYCHDQGPPECTEQCKACRDMQRDMTVQPAKPVKGDIPETKIEGGLRFIKDFYGKDAHEVAKKLVKNTYKSAIASTEQKLREAEARAEKMEKLLEEEFKQGRRVYRIDVEKDWQQFRESKIDNV